MGSSNTIYYLEMKDKNDFIFSPVTDQGFTIVKVNIKQFKLNRFLYDIVGEPFLWFDKKNWSENQWKDYVFNDNLHTWVAYKEGAIAGYFELLVLEKKAVEIKYFGLTEDFIGKGYGSGFLSHAVKEAWNLGASKVILNTCSKDHPAALKNYLDRGFNKIREESS